MLGAVVYSLRAQMDHDSKPGLGRSTEDRRKRGHIAVHNLVFRILVVLLISWHILVRTIWHTIAPGAPPTVSRGA
jgi:hypothetical protein